MNSGGSSNSSAHAVATCMIWPEVVKLSPGCQGLSDPSWSLSSVRSMSPLFSRSMAFCKVMALVSRHTLAVGKCWMHASDSPLMQSPHSVVGSVELVGSTPVMNGRNCSMVRTGSRGSSSPTPRQCIMALITSGSIPTWTAPNIEPSPWIML